MLPAWRAKRHAGIAAIGGGLELRSRLLAELRQARVTAGISQKQLAAALGCSQAEVCRRERQQLQDGGLVMLAEMAAVLGLELSAGLHPAGQPIRDKGHQALIGRFRERLAPAWRVAAEVPFPRPGDPRWWDLVLRLAARQIVGVEAETRVRDQQDLVRRMHGRQRDGGASVVLLVLSDSRANREQVDELRVALGEEFATSPRALLAALRAGTSLPGSGVILL
ncbi:MAG TPA: helix-turn-helix transcriptional regulator [Candidatus Limnocylindria bacterium]|jgi:transcriptional regulator with XRE-family HTH domain|nr:helix-turn-helix transcriptional regulator [Candidatus Limnocylindria bacterium]